MFLFYNLFILILLIISSPFLLLKLQQKKELSFLCARLGILPAGRVISSDKLIWFHAASVGEINGIYPIVKNLCQKNSNLEFIVTTYTSNGLKRAQEIFSGLPIVFFSILPIDFGPVIKRFLKRIHPKILVISETELWPNLIGEAKKENITIIVVNGRVSDKTYSKYHRFRFFFRRVLKNIDFYCAQTEVDKDRIVSLGILPELVEICGNAKYSFLPKIGQEISIELSRPVIVAGSTRPGEEEIIISAFKGLLNIFPDANLIIAPRHLERIPEVEKIVKKAGISYELKSKISKEAWSIEQRAECKIIILDTMGELNTFYKIADITFVGGTLAPYGGHNLLEPAAFSKPVIFGPFYSNLRDIGDELEKTGGGRKACNSEEIKNIFVEILSDEKKKKNMGELAHSVFLKHKEDAYNQSKIILERL